MTQSYSHRQIGTLLLIGLGIAFGTAMVGLMLAGAPIEVIVIFAGIFAFTEALAGWLTIEVGDGKLSWQLGVGLISGSVALSEITEVSVVRNPWYYGWGMHLTPDGWLYNVAGSEGIRVQTGSGRKFRLGSDEAQKLLDAINEARG